jgi:ABC-2 type transport system ATP-binding protein
MRHPIGPLTPPAPACPTHFDDEEFPVRRAATVLLTAALTSGGLAALAPPASADISPQALTITVTGLGPDQHTCQMDADLYVPLGASRTSPAPAVLTTNGFGGTKKDQANTAQGLGEQGYVTLAYTGLGFLDHDTCPITLDDREHDGQAASQLLRFLGGDPSISAVDQTTGAAVHVDQVIRDDGPTGTRYDPRVGMIGGSYGGQIQFAAAAVEHQGGANRLDTIIPIITWNDLSYSLDPNNQLPKGTAANGSVSSDDPGAFKYQWSLFFTGVGVGNGAQDATAVTDPAQAQSLFDQLATGQNCANFTSEVCTALAEVAAQGYPSQKSITFLRHASVASYMSDVRVPTFLAQGQADTLFNLQESVATYASLQAQNTPVALQWQSWGHSRSAPVSGELDQRNPAASYEGRQVLAWFGHYLKHQGSAPPLGFSYFRDWKYPAGGGTQADVARAYTTGPLPGSTNRTFYLSGADLAGATVLGTSTGGGSLVTKQRDVQPGTSHYTGGTFGPNYSETSAVESSLQPEPPVSDPPGTSIRFLTPALTQPLVVVGSPQLTVQLDAPTVSATQSAGAGAQLVVFAKLYDVGPDGTVELPNRLVSPARITDVTKPITLELPGIVHQFASGHRLAVVLAGGDLAYRGSTGPQPVALTTGGTQVQRLTVPVGH